MSGSSDEDDHQGVAPTDPSAELAGVIERNVRTLAELRQREHRRQSRSEWVAGQITRFAGSMWSVYVHLLLYAGWLIVNVGWVPSVKPWDPLLVQLAMIASVEAIFLSTFILISQNRMQAVSDRRAELDLQVNLLAEHEVTRVIRLLDLIARKMQISEHEDESLDEVKRDVSPVKVAEVIEKAEQAPEGGV